LENPLSGRIDIVRFAGQAIKISRSENLVISLFTSPKTDLQGQKIEFVENQLGRCGLYYSSLKKMA